MLMANTLVYIIECLHYLLVSGILERILTNRTICGKNSRPDPHVNTAKVQMAAQVIKVATFGLDTSVDCLFYEQFWSSTSGSGYTNEVIK
jgi:hypothetical protein